MPFVLEPSWNAQIGAHVALPAMRALAELLAAERAAGKSIYPPAEQTFAAFDHTPFDAVRVVILGQDPYHGPGQAHGLSFSVPPGVSLPPSLVNIFKELARDLDVPRPNHGCLSAWAKQGVLLLNSVLSVEGGRAASHQGKGWEEFTDAVISAINTERDHVVFMLWGAYAQKKGRVIDATKHLVLNAVHPSPLSAHRGFIGCGHFSAANAYLEAHGKTAIEWSLPPAASLTP